MARVRCAPLQQGPFRSTPNACSRKGKRHTNSITAHETTAKMQLSTRIQARQQPGDPTCNSPSLPAFGGVNVSASMVDALSGPRGLRFNVRASGFPGPAPPLALGPLRRRRPSLRPLRRLKRVLRVFHQRENTSWTSFGSFVTRAVGLPLDSTMFRCHPLRRLPGTRLVGQSPLSV